MHAKLITVDFSYLIEKKIFLQLKKDCNPVIKRNSRMAFKKTRGRSL
jgi:hypothetical protein